MPSRRTTKSAAARARRPAGGAAEVPVQRFTALLERPEGATTFACFRVPRSVVDAFAPRLRVPVIVTINKFTWRTTIAPYGGDFFIPLREEVRTAIGADAAKQVAVIMQHDTAPRVVDLPPDLARALTKAGVRKTFDALPFSHRKEYVQWVAQAKRPETRQRRIEATVEKVGDR